MQVINLLQLIDKLEEEKWQCVLQGAEFRPELQTRFLKIEKKLDRLYVWAATAYKNGLLYKPFFGKGFRVSKRKNG